jgi:hypothetical protein
MRVEAAVTSISWIPSEAISGMTKMPFSMGVAHYDDPPPDALANGAETLAELRDADRFRFANRLDVVVDFDDAGRPTHWERQGHGLIGSTTMKVGRKRRATFEATSLDDIAPEPEIGDDSVTFRQTAGGRTGVPAPRHVSHPPFVQWQAPLAWSTLELTVRADGTSVGALVGASPFPRHWIYDTAGALVAKSGMVDFKDWYRSAFGKHSPWGDEDSPALATAVETALERELSVDLMRGEIQPTISTHNVGDVLMTQGEAGDHVMLILDGVLSVTVDGDVLAEVGPGALLGERAALEGGVRTATLTAVTKVKSASVPAAALDADALVELSDGHRREET